MNVAVAAMVATSISLIGALFEHEENSTSVEVLAQMSLVYGSALVLGYGGFAVNQTALIAITYGFVGLDALNAFVDAVVDLALKYDYTEDDPLASYIVPGSADLKKMNERPWNERTPMLSYRGSF